MSAAQTQYTAGEQDLACAILSLADTAGMPDTFWQSDGRVALARAVLGVPEDGRYTHAHLWSGDDEDEV